jgi:hypothetical protein
MQDLYLPVGDRFKHVLSYYGFGVCAIVVFGHVLQHSNLEELGEGGGGKVREGGEGRKKTVPKWLCTKVQKILRCILFQF